MNSIASLIDFHGKMCSRILYGECSTRRCLVRGGWSAGDGSGYDKATCEAFETCRILGDAIDASVKLEQDGGHL